MIAVITGATKGIGRAIAIALAKNGYNLALCSRTQSDLDELENQLKFYGVEVLCVTADCSQKIQVTNFCNAVMHRFGKADVLINNAGAYTPGVVLEENDDDFEYQLAVNLSAVYYTAKFFGKVFRQQRNGHIFNICSVAALQPVAHAGSYSVTKAAMLSLNNVMRNELAKYNVKVTAIIPGATLTASWDGTDIAGDRFVQPEDVAKAILQALASSSGANVDQIRVTPLNF